MNPVRTVATALYRNATKVLIIFWSIMVVAQLAVSWLAWRLNDDGTGQWDTLTPPKYFLAIYAISAAYGYLPQFVGQGIIRRHFLYGSAVFFASLAAALAVLTVATNALTFFVLRAFGVVPEQAQFQQSWAVLIGAALVYVAWAASGWLAGLGFYRFGNAYGIAFLPVIAIPVVVSELAFRMDPALGLGSYGQFSFVSGTTVDPARFAVDAAIAALSVLVGLAVAIVVIRNTAIRKVSG
jgi:hypothetical protein